jgi:hypothetical protein
LSLLRQQNEAIMYTVYKVIKELLNMKNKELIYKCKCCGNLINLFEFHKYCIKCGFYIEPTLEEAKLIIER